MNINEIPTPALVIDSAMLDRNLALMADAWPGRKLRPHVKAHKISGLAKRQAALGHTGFTCATIREVEVMAAAGLGEDLLLANEVTDMRRLGKVVESGARVTVAVDSEALIKAAVEGGVREVLIDVNVGLPRCGCAPEDAGRLADTARAAGLEVRGVMGYEGHLMLVEDVADKTRQTDESMSLLLKASSEVGGDIVSGGGTGTWRANSSVNELQAGSYALMDTTYSAVEDIPFEPALTMLATVISVNPTGWAVADAGLKAFGMDHGDPKLPGSLVWYCSDEHVVFSMDEGNPWPVVGDKVRLLPAHVDPTCALHARAYVVDSDEVIDVWDVDMRNW